MKKISKSIKKCLAFCLTASMLMSTAATVSAEETTATDRLWAVNYQNGGNVTNTVNFGAVGKGGIHCINLKGNRFAAKALASSDAGTISDESFLILDVNMATNEDGLTIYSQPDGNLPLIQNIPFDKGQWHAVRLVVQKPMLEDEKIPTLGDGTVNTSAKGYLAKHKVYVDGKLAGTYNAVEGDRQRYIRDGKWVVNNTAWGVSVDATKDVDKYIYTADLRVSSAAEDPGEYTLPSIDANAAFKVLNGNIMPTQAAGVKVSDITSADGDVFVTDTSGTEKTGDAVLADGDRIVVAKDKLYNTYFYKTNHVFYERNDWSGSIGTANGLTATKVNTISGKASTDSSVKVTNSEAAGPYLTFGNFNDIAGADYMVYEVNIMPTDGLDKIQFTTNRAYGLSPQINANKLKTDCWNKVIFVVRKNDLHTDGTYLSDVYANGSFDRTATAQKLPGDTVPKVNEQNPEIPVSNIRLNFTPIKDAKGNYVTGELAYVDDIKVYEAWYRPEIAPYTVTDSENAVYDKDNNMMYATSNAAIATACDATLASEGNGWVIVNRGNENYSKYNVRTFTANTISHDAATNEFWGKTTSETTDKDKFIAATYDASGRLTGARLIDGTSIGDKILKCTFTPTESSRLFFWNFENLRPHAQSLDVTVSK